MINLRREAPRYPALSRQHVLGLGLLLMFGILVLGGLSWRMQQTITSLHAQKMTLLEAVKAARSQLTASIPSELAVDLSTPNGLAQGMVALMQADLSDVCFTSLHVTSQAFVLHGQAASDAALTQFLKAWRVSRLFSEIHIQSLVWDDTANHLNFEFSAMALPLDGVNHG